MNKISATLTGLALVAGASIAPAFAGGGVFSTSTVTPPKGTFVDTTTSYSFLTSDATYSVGTNSLVGTLSLIGTEVGTGPFYTTTLDFTSGTSSIQETGTTIVFPGPDQKAPLSPTNFKIADAGNFTFGDRLTVGPFANPVPEASTVLSFGGLLALGGLAFLRRKTASAAV